MPRQRISRETYVFPVDFHERLGVCPINNILNDMRN